MNPELTDWQIVRQSHAIHPRWSLADHVAYLANEEGRIVRPDLVGLWLAQMDRLPPLEAS